MFSDIEFKCVQQLMDKKDKYLKAFEEFSEQKQLSQLYEFYINAYNKYAIEIISATPMPTKPLDAYVAGGIANGIGGVAPAIATFCDAKIKEEKYQQSMEQYNSKLKGIQGACDELAYYYGAIVNLLNTNTITGSDWESTRKLIEDDVKNKKKAVQQTNLTFAFVGALVLALLFGIPCWVASGNFIVLLCVGGLSFFIAFFYILVKNGYFRVMNEQMKMEEEIYAEKKKQKETSEMEEKILNGVEYLCGEQFLNEINSSSEMELKHEELLAVFCYIESLVSSIDKRYSTENGFTMFQQIFQIDVILSVCVKPSYDAIVFTICQKCLSAAGVDKFDTETKVGAQHVEQFMKRVNREKRELVYGDEEINDKAQVTKKIENTQKNIFDIISCKDALDKYENWNR